jgi:hypothetical protein
MQIKTRLVAALAFGTFGAFIMWLCAVKGWNRWSSTSTYAHTWDYVVTSVLYGYWGYIYTRGKPAAVRLSAIAAGAILGAAITWLSTAIGLYSWIADGASWHAALMGFVIFALTAAFAPLLASRSKT